MKLLFENWRNYLSEISFSAASAFEFDGRRWENRVYVYRFSDHEDETYEVFFTPTDGGSIISWDIGYKAEHGEYYELTGKGIVVKIMATVAQIVLDFIKRPDRPVEDQKRIFYFSGALGPGEVEHSGPQSAGKRTRLYTYMLKKMLPAGWDMSEDMDTPNAMWFFNEKELGTLSEHEEDFINSLGANIKDIKDKIKQPGMQGAPEEEEDDDMTFSDPFGLLHENWRRYLKENKEDYAESVETAELEMIQELLDASETFRAAWKEMEQSIEGTSHHFGETTAEHTRNVLKELDIIIDSMDEEIDAVRKRKLRLAAALHDIALSLIHI